MPMLYDPKAPSAKWLHLIALRPEQLDSIDKEFDLYQFDFDRPHAIICINRGNYAYLNIRDPDDRATLREARRLMAISPIGEYRGCRDSAKGSVLSLMKSVGTPVEWRPCGPDGIVLPFQTCYNASSASQLFCPRGR